MVEVVIRDESGETILSLKWRRRSKEVCYSFPDRRIAKASFKSLARELGVEEDFWKDLGI